MKRKLSTMILVVALVLTLLVGCGQKGAKTSSSAGYPNKALTSICPWSAGGGTDTILRGLCKSAEDVLGQTITVTNQTGGGGAIGHAAIMNAPTDGYTVGMITFELNSLPPQGLVDFTYEDFEPLVRVNMDAAAITVPKDAPYNNIKEFVEYAKAHPGEVRVGNSGTGSVWHIAAGLLAEETGIELVYVPFDGAAPAVTALVGGHIDAVSVSASEVQGQVEAGDLKILGMMSAERVDLFPDVPTLKEEGIDVVFGTWRGMAAPIGTPDDVLAKLEDTFKQAMESEEFVEYAKNSGLVLAYQNSDDFKEFLGQNAKDVEEVMKSLGLAK